MPTASAPEPVTDIRHDGGTPLVETTFTVIDLETTGVDPETCAITEFGAARFQGGRCEATFTTLADPAVPVPPLISALTGITDAMVASAPPLDTALDGFTAFVGDTVLVGHNVGFDQAFLDRSLRALGRIPLANAAVDTLTLSRRFVRGEVTNHRLPTLAAHFGVAARPRHRALADTFATAAVFHALLERAGAAGIVTLDALLRAAASRGSGRIGVVGSGPA